MTERGPQVDNPGRRELFKRTAAILGSAALGGGVIGIITTSEVSQTDKQELDAAQWKKNLRKMMDSERGRRSFFSSGVAGLGFITILVSMIRLSSPSPSEEVDNNQHA